MIFHVDDIMNKDQDLCHVMPKKGLVGTSSAKPCFAYHSYRIVLCCLNMRNRDPHRENVENILAINLPILTMKHIRESPSVSHAIRKRAWNADNIL